MRRAGGLLISTCAFGASGPQDAAGPVLERMAAEGIVVDLAHQEVRVPGVVLRQEPSPEYPVEYSIVTGDGFTHEALAMVTCTPSLLNAALIWIGLEPGESRRVELRADAPAEEDVRLGLEDPFVVYPPSGMRVFCYLRWIGPDGAEEIHALEDVLMDVRSGEPLPFRGFVYTGSRFVEHSFGRELRTVYIADYEGNIATIYPDRGAARNCLFDVYSKDPEQYRFADVNPDLLPAPGTPLTFLFTPRLRPGSRPVDVEVERPEVLLDAAPALARRSRNPYLREADRELLERVGTRTLEDLLAMMRRAQEPLRQLVAGLLGASGRPEVIPELRDSLRFDRSDDARLSSAYALVELGTSDAYRALLAGLKSRWWAAREDALFGLRLWTGEDLGRDPARWEEWGVEARLLE